MYICVVSVVANEGIMKHNILNLNGNNTSSYNVIIHCHLRVLLHAKIVKVQANNSLEYAAY